MSHAGEHSAVMSRPPDGAVAAPVEWQGMHVPCQAVVLAYAARLWRVVGLAHHTVGRCPSPPRRRALLYRYSKCRQGKRRSGELASDRPCQQKCLPRRFSPADTGGSPRRAQRPLCALAGVMFCGRRWISMSPRCQRLCSGSAAGAMRFVPSGAICSFPPFDESSPPPPPSSLL